MHRNPLEFLEELNERILTENITENAVGTMLFDSDGVRFTEDIEDEFVRPGKEITFVETRHAQQLSWVVSQFKEGLSDVITYYEKSIFYGKIAEAANAFIAKSDDLTGLLLAVLMQASLMTVQTQMFKNQDVKAEVMACVASLTDVADSI